MAALLFGAAAVWLGPVVLMAGGALLLFLLFLLAYAANAITWLATKAVEIWK